MKFIFVRHGQTDWNRQKKLMGRSDIELNDEGRVQATEVVKMLTGDFDALYSSPLKRAYQTAEAISEHFGKPIIVSEKLIERDFGSLSGKSWAEIESATKEDLKAVTKEEKYDFRPWGGESVDDVRARLLGFLDEVQQKPYSKVVVVCHSGIISLMRHLFPNNETAHISNTSINEFELSFGTDFSALLKKELHVVVHGQSLRFRAVKYAILIPLIAAIYWWKGKEVLFWAISSLAVLGVVVHFVFRWKTKGWTEDWWVYKSLFRGK